MSCTHHPEYMKYNNMLRNKRNMAKVPECQFKVVE